jgi:hypothetical protein
MARIDPRTATKFDQETDRSNVKYVLATLPLAIVLIMFTVEAYQRPSKPFYNMPADVTDDAVLRQAAEASGSLVPLMDMCYVVLSFGIFWAILAGYFLIFLKAQHAMVETYLEKGRSVLGNVVYERKGWACEFRYYGYCSYTHPEPSSDPNAMGDATIIRKQVRVQEPYTRELVPILYLPGYPKSGQGKDDVEFASLVGLKDKPRENFLGWFSFVWTLICIGVTVFILHQMSVIDEAEYNAGVTDDYDNVKKGWKVFSLFVGIGIFGVAICGTGLAWLNRRWWLLHQGTLSMGDLSIHGFDGVVVASTGDDYQRMAGHK